MSEKIMGIPWVEFFLIVVLLIIILLVSVAVLRGPREKVLSECHCENQIGFWYHDDALLRMTTDEYYQVCLPECE